MNHRSSSVVNVDSKLPWNIDEALGAAMFKRDNPPALPGDSERFNLCVGLRWF